MGQPLIAAALAVGAVPVVVEAESVALALGDAEVALGLDEAGRRRAAARG